MRCPTFVFATLFVFAVSMAQAAGLRAFDIPAGPAITNEMFAKEPNDARVEVTVKGRSVEAGRIGTGARQVRC